MSLRRGRQEFARPPRCKKKYLPGTYVIVYPFKTHARTCACTYAHIHPKLSAFQGTSSKKANHTSNNTHPSPLYRVWPYFQTTHRKKILQTGQTAEPRTKKQRQTQPSGSVWSGYKPDTARRRGKPAGPSTFLPTSLGGGVGPGRKLVRAWSTLPLRSSRIPRLLNDSGGRRESGYPPTKSVHIYETSDRKGGKPYYWKPRFFGMGVPARFGGFQRRNETMSR